jgi:hypothetical protein
MSLDLTTGLARTKSLRESLIPQKRDILESAKFFKKSDDEVIQDFFDAFEAELVGLQKVTPPVESTRSPDEVYHASPSQKLFEVDYPEVNRTITGMLALKWIIARNYDSFTVSQEKKFKLSQESFDKLRGLFLTYLRDGRDVYALLVSTVVNDMGKSPELFEKVASFLPISEYSTEPNHDMIGFIAAKNGVFPLIDEVRDTEYYPMLLDGLLFGSQVNIAQLAQAENVPGNLLFISKGLSTHNIHGIVNFIEKGKLAQTFKMKFMELILDVAGAYGHIDARGAKPMTEPVYQTYLATQDALLHIIEQGYSPRDAYDEVLNFRAKLLEKTKFRSLSVKDTHERALLRLLSMGRTATREQAGLFEAAFDALSPSCRNALVDGLSVDGIEDGVAIIPYYAPALFSETLKRTGASNRETKIAALSSVMRFLTRIYASTKPEPGTPGQLVECDVSFAVTVIKGNHFVTNPSILDDLRIPDASLYQPHKKK